VSHQGDPPELFKPGIPVVLEGRFQGATFASDRIMVKHSEDYVAKHPSRVTTPPSSTP
jgi:cytochrome c-type biogenesis protein CcmE